MLARQMNQKQYERKTFIREFLMNRACNIPADYFLSEDDVKSLVNQADIMWEAFDKATEEKVEEVNVVLK